MSDENLLLFGKRDRPLVRTIEVEQKIVQRVEITRSFSYKLNCEMYSGNRFESRDFFCSQKAECAVEDAPDVAAALYHFCKSQVLESVRDYIAEMRKQRGVA
jgi:hypothetical protein